MQKYILFLFIVCTSCDIDQFIGDLNDDSFKEIRFEINGKTYRTEGEASRYRYKKDISLALYAYEISDIIQLRLEVQHYTNSDSYREVPDSVKPDTSTLSFSYSQKIENDYINCESSTGEVLILHDNNRWVEGEFAFEVINYDDYDTPLDTVQVENGYFKLSYRGSAAGSPVF